jgi:hypothetical protein
MSGPLSRRGPPQCYAVLHQRAGGWPPPVPPRPPLLPPPRGTQAGGRIRPIAIREVWLRLAGLCVLQACGINGLVPLQLGVGV